MNIPRLKRLETSSMPRSTAREIPATARSSSTSNSTLAAISRVSRVMSARMSRSSPSCQRSKSRFAQQTILSTEHVRHVAPEEAVLDELRLAGHQHLLDLVRTIEQYGQTCAKT